MDTRERCNHRANQNLNRHACGKGSVKEDKKMAQWIQENDVTIEQTKTQIDMRVEKALSKKIRRWHNGYKRTM